MNPLFEEIEKIISSKFSDEKKTDQIRFVLGGHKKLTFKTISDLLSQNFSVPSYQRGYKWKAQQVSDLLNDIWEFSKTDPAEDQFYCLQPIIVKREMNKATNQWSVIDGQQRLTTIYLILKYFGTTSFSLDYNTRDDSGIYLTSTDRSSVKDNIDIFHFKLAEKTITAWFEGKSDEDKTLWEKTLLTKTRIIWYNPDSSDAKSEIDVFTRINSGKIPLTNSELIRALFIHHSKRSENDEVTLLLQHKIASEWDYIEQQLHDEDFWCFVTLGQPFQKKTYPNRIEYFLDLVEARHKGSRTDDTYSTFRMYSLWISQENKEVSHLWQELKNLYYRFHEWYFDRDLYHLTGFARLAVDTLENPGSAKKRTILVLLEWADGKTQSSLITHIKSTVRKQLFGDGIIANTQIDRELFDKAKGRLRNILLLANIAQQVNPQNKNRANEDNKAALQRFNLRAYIRESWDIEHIRSQTPTQDKKEWCKAILDYWGVTGAKDAAGDSLKEKVWNAVAGSATIEDALVKEIENHFDGLSAGKEGEVNAGDFVDSLGNYCLLDASTNRSYGNAPFPVKRKTIIQRVQDGAFVPLVTQNVFLKVYSENTANMMQWTQDDAANYRQQMLNAISTFLGEQQ